MTLEIWRRVYATLQLDKDMTDFKEALSQLYKKTNDPGLKKAIENALGVLESVSPTKKEGGKKEEAGREEKSKVTQEEQKEIAKKFENAYEERLSELGEHATKSDAISTTILQKWAIFKRWEKILQEDITDDESIKTQIDQKNNALKALDESLAMIRDLEIPKVKEHALATRKYIKYCIITPDKKSESYAKDVFKFMEDLPKELEEMYKKMASEKGVFARLIKAAEEYEKHLKLKAGLDPTNFAEELVEKRKNLLGKWKRMGDAILEYSKAMGSFVKTLDEFYHSRAPNA